MILRNNKYLNDLNPRDHLQRYNQRNYVHSIDDIDFLNIFSEKGLDISEEKDSSNYVLIKGGSESITEINYNDNLDYSLFIGTLNDKLTKKDDVKNKKRFRTEPINPTRGRKPSKNNKKAIHSKHEYYNILTKIQVHFFRFLINFLNDIAYALLKNRRYFFVTFNHREIRIVNNKFQTFIKKKTIQQILKKFRISPKYTKKDKDINKKHLKFLSKFEPFKKLVNIDYLNFLKIYYNNKKPLKEYIINDKAIRLSDKTKSYSYLIKENIYDEEFFDETLKNAYDINTQNSIQLEEKDEKENEF